LKHGELNSRAWGLPGVLDFFATHRRTDAEVYPSERFFLMGRLKEGVSVLDVGCAQGGFAEIIGARLRDFSYTGIDINPQMIDRARTRHPGHRFHLASEGDYSVLDGERFDVVLVLGILHLHEAWRATLAGAWDHTQGSLIFDLRQVDGPSLEDRERSYMRMDLGGERNIEERVPYILVNAADAQRTVFGSCSGAASIAHYGYRHLVTAHAVCPVQQVMTTTWCVDR
jgi:SAM-dependent methyltransferase